MDGSVVSNGWKHCFQSLEAGLLMGRIRKRQGAITRLQDYTLFFEPQISKIAYIYHIFY
jgi:hypothetical protein